MPPDAQRAMLATLDHGPAACPPTLFTGSPDRVLLGLKAHANTIHHARHVALEETFPETRCLLGAERFHAVAEQHIPTALDRPIVRIGEAFPERLDGPARDMARLELAWLEAHGATDAQPLDLAAVSIQAAEALLQMRVMLHPATRCLAGNWEGQAFRGNPLRGTQLLVTRPEADVLVTTVAAPVANLVRLTSAPTTMAALFETDADATIALVQAGALTQEIDR